MESVADHVIVCGWNAVGRACAESLRAAGRSVVVITRDPALLAGEDYPHVIGNASDYQALEAAGIARAHTLVAALDDDTDNLWLTVTARELRPNLYILARAADERSGPKFLRAGADRVLDPQQIGGRHIGLSARQPHLADFLDEVLHDVSRGYRIDAVDIAQNSPLAGQHLRKIAVGERTGVLLLAIRLSGNGPFISDPPPTTLLAPGSALIVIGTANQLAELRKLAAPQCPS